MNINEEILKKRSRQTELEAQLSDPAVLSKPKKLEELNREYAAIKECLDIAGRYEKTKTALDEAQSTAAESADEEMKTLAEQEEERLTEELSKLETELLAELVPPEPLDSKNVYVEIRAGTGGDEAGLFAADLYRMYQRYAELKGWKTNLVAS
ncbi:PCRF domain-containing protein, partial [Patescibacteria group bacterium]|nr:PCRF domain-containing protein [Patescibacteria group bacterium]